MFSMYLDNRLLWSVGDTDKKILSPNVNLAVNSVGSASFKILPTHIYYNSFVRMGSIITIIENNRIIFKGRVYGEKSDFQKVKTIQAEGVLGYLNDSIVRPYEFTGSPADYLAYLLNQHNGQVADHQKFILGRVTVIDSNDYITRASSDNPTTWKEITDKLINILGGYIVIRYENNGNYIDYLADYEDTSTQEIKFAVNLLDLSSECNAGDLATCIIPYGAEGEDGNRIDITSVNNGVDYVSDASSVATYGKIFEVVTWDDVTLPENLLRKANLYLSTRVHLTDKITLKAIDLHLTDSTIESFKLGDYVRVFSTPHNIDEPALITEYKIDLLDPSKSTITVGIQKESYLSDNRKNVDKINNNIDNKITQRLPAFSDAVLEESKSYTNDMVDNAEEYTRTMLGDYTLKTELELLTKQTTTQFKQTSDDFTMQFGTVNKRITTENAEIIERLNRTDKYIRYVDGAIILGEVGNKLTTKIDNGRISFLYNDTTEVAYISDKRLYILEAEILDKIIIGQFCFVPQTNGSLSFKHV